MAWPNASADDAVLLHAASTPVRAPVRGQVSHSGIHRLVRGLNRSTRVFPVSPKLRITYCAPRTLRTYTLPGVAVPDAVNVANPLAPSRIGSPPGLAPPGSMGGES